ncbi:MAG TPA: cation-translocating P-type ATPase [Thermoanaerobaculia bacterium]|nr:cation-translocating P-type ATPase [Thermoanaerobaculia bacterium]
MEKPSRGSAEFDLRRAPGLTDAEAAARLAREGPNELPSTRRRSLVSLAAEIVKEPMILLLLACGGVYVLLGDREEALVLLASVFGVVGLSLYQSRKTERALDALRDLSSPRALVVRDGRERRIPGREVVRGDLVILAEGDRVPADGVLLRAMSLSADESLLTGESVPVTKLADESAAEAGPPGGDVLPWVWSGTLVVRGQGVARVSATGPKTELGKIGKALQTLDTNATPLQTQTARWVRVLAAAGLALCALLALAFGLIRGGWLEGLLAGLALAMSLVPEEFPVILTVFLALGAWRISRRNVLTRRAAAIEALGSATVLCVDKTGTLTENRMAVAALEAGGQTWEVTSHRGEPLPETFHALVEFALLASRQKPFDPMERAVETLARGTLAGTEHLHGGWALVHEYPLGRELLAVTHVWEPEGGGPRVVAAKGAPEAVADLCHLPAAKAEALLAVVAQFAERGLRMLAVARATAPPGPLPPSAHDLTYEYLGLVCLADPLRAGVPEAVAECERAGVRTVMITGDYPGTARAIASGAGLPPGDVMTGSELDALDDAALSSRVTGTRLFARVVPEQKLRLVNAFKADGEVVAMTGDGVNDAPALKAAHIGIAMGGRGTDVAREASALVLLDDDYSSIVAAIRLGRRIFENIRKAMAYVLSVHVPIAGSALVPALVGWPLVLLPVHIVLLELVIDPACSIAFEAEPGDPGLMRRPPRDPREPLLPRRIVVRALLDGILALIVVLGIAAFSVARGDVEGRTRALAFSALLLLNLALILTHRSTGQTLVASLRMPNPAIWWVLGGAIGVLGLCLGIAPIRELLRFGSLSGADVALAAGAGVGGLAGFELLKAGGRKFDASASSTPPGPVGA